MFLYLFLLLSACSSTPENNDPHQEFNRDMFKFNLAVDKNLLRPAAVTYKDSLPTLARESVSNFLINIKEPFHFVNYAATMEVDLALTSLFRFVINSTVGFFGLFDIGEKMGLKKSETSYKESLRKIGVPNGDYIMLPFLGSSSTRDAIAEPISWFLDPIGYYIGLPYMFAKAIVSEINYRAENLTFIDSTMRESVDLYSTSKSIYFQKYGVKSPEQKKQEEMDEFDEFAE